MPRIVLFRLFFVITVILNASLSCLGLLLRVIEIKLKLKTETELTKYLVQG